MASTIDDVYRRMRENKEKDGVEKSKNSNDNNNNTTTTSDQENSEYSEWTEEDES